MRKSSDKAQSLKNLPLLFVRTPDTTHRLADLLRKKRFNWTLRTDIKRLLALAFTLDLFFLLISFLSLWHPGEVQKYWLEEKVKRKGGYTKREK